MIGTDFLLVPTDLRWTNFEIEPYQGIVEVQTPEMFINVGLSWWGIEDSPQAYVLRGTISGKMEAVPQARYT